MLRSAGGDRCANRRPARCKTYCGGGHATPKHGGSRQLQPAAEPAVGRCLLKPRTALSAPFSPFVGFFPRPLLCCATTARAGGVGPGRKFLPFDDRFHRYAVFSGPARYSTTAKRQSIIHLEPLFRLRWGGYSRMKNVPGLRGACGRENSYQRPPVFRRGSCA